MDALWAFAGVALLLVLTPGADFAVVVPNALRSRRTGFATAFGTASGLAVHAGIAAAGLSAIVLASDLAFSAVKYAGAAFLVLLGIRALIKSRRDKAPAPTPAPAELRQKRLTLFGAYRQGLVVNVLNPKAPLIYLSVMPQFLQPQMPANAQLLWMSGILVAIALAWYLLLTVVIGLVRPAVQRFGAWIDRVTGVVLIGLGARVALESRPV